MSVVKKLEEAPHATLPFYNNQIIPLLDMEDDLKLKCAPYTGLAPNYDKDCIVMERNQGYAGIYTTNMSYCHALTMVERDEHGAISKIAMQHFSGGLDKERLEGFISHCNDKKGFTGHLELVHYPGCAEETSQFAELLQNRKFNSQNDIQRIYHADSSSSCCVMFNGRIGKAEFAPKEILRSEVTECRLNLSNLIQRDARHYFHDLIRNAPQEKKELLYELEQKILNDKTLKNPAELLEKTRQLIVEAEFFPDKKKDLYEKYTADLNKQPSLSSGTKIACAALAATIIGIIPALIIAHHYKSALKELRSQQLNLVDESLEREDSKADMRLG